MKTLVITMLLLAGCTTVPVTQEFPELPQVLKEPCPPLETIDSSTITLSDFLKKVEKNYDKRHECAALTESLQKWYIEQKKIFDAANN